MRNRNDEDKNVMAKQMVSSFFIFEEGNIISVNPKLLLVPEFQRLWNRDKSKNKAKALREFAFIYFMADIESEYNSYGLDKEEQVCEDIFGDRKFQPDEMLIEAVDKYERFQETYSMRYLKATRKQVDRLIKYHTDMATAKDKDYDPKVASASMKNIEEIMEKLEKWEKKISGEAEQMIIRGGGRIGLFEDKESATYL